MQIETHGIEQSKEGPVIKIKEKMPDDIVKKMNEKWMEGADKFEKEEDEMEKKELLKQEMQQQELENYTPNEINFIDSDYWNTWDMLKGHMKKMWGHKEEYIDESPSWCFLAHSKDKIKGKPQLVENVQKKIPLIRLAVKKKIEGKGDDKFETAVQSFYFFDERFDRRYDGSLRDTFSMYFYFYQIITDDEKKYYILSQKKLPSENCEFNGMLVEIPDFAEMNRNLKIPSISGFFIVKDFEPAVKIIPKKDLIEYTKENKITEQEWLDFLARHPLGTINNFPLEVEMLRSAFVLSGKCDGWPLHLGYLGPPGTRKTMGQIETLSHKFSEEPRIAEGSGWRLKGLIPSFKQAIADVGFLAKAERIGFIDELWKMVERELNNHQETATNLLGDLNYLLEHKRRVVGSGNTGEVEVQSGAKFLFASNPVSRRKTLSEHIGLIDPTFMSRVLWWVQDKAEQELVLGVDGFYKIPPQPMQDQAPSEILPRNTPKSNSDWDMVLGNRKKGLVLGKLWGEYGSRDMFLTLFDTCYSFLCEIDDDKVAALADVITALAVEPMKSSVWRPRAYHHVRLLIDGLCKHRCLFRDYDNSFTPKEEDYVMAERILIRMVHGWNTDLSPKEDVYDNS